LRAEVDRLRQRVAELDEMAHSDPLVKLPNRRSFDAALQRLVGRVERYDEAASMIFIDVDGLKQINDRHGHQAGDISLVEIAQILQTSVRKSDFVARLSGDEFAILMSHADELMAWTMGLRIVESVVGANLRVDGKRVPLSVAVGVAQIRQSDSSQAVISRADQAMYAIKAA